MITCLSQKCRGYSLYLFFRINFNVHVSNGLNIFYVYSFLRERERQSMSGGGAEREGDTESEAGSRLRAVGTEPDVGLELTSCEIMT